MNFKNKLIITNKEYPNKKNVKKLDIYDEKYHWGKLIDYVPESCHRKRYIDKIKYLTWLNRGYNENIK